MTQQLSKIVWKSKSRHFFSVNDTKSAAECTVTIYRYKTIWANANTGEIQLPGNTSAPEGSSGRD